MIPGLSDSYEETIHDSLCEWTLLEKTPLFRMNSSGLLTMAFISGCQVIIWRIDSYLKPGDSKVIFESLSVSGLVFLLDGMNRMATVAVAGGQSCPQM